MGGDKLMPAVSGVREDSTTGAAIAKRRAQIFAAQYLPQLGPFPDAGRLVGELKARGCRVVAASSAKRDELKPLLEIVGADLLMDASTSSDDASNSKPDPDIVHAALTRAEASPDEAIMIGDTPYDVEAARRAGLDIIAFRCGGWTDEDLTGAVAIYDGPWDLLLGLEDSPLGR
jgi:HAD superfamily hydrolase (TIGR01509 family)